MSDQDSLHFCYLCPRSRGPLIALSNANHQACVWTTGQGVWVTYNDMSEKHARFREGVCLGANGEWSTLAPVPGEGVSTDLGEVVNSQWNFTWLSAPGNARHRGFCSACMARCSVNTCNSSGRQIALCICDNAAPECRNGGKTWTGR
jgi:hypothetical protein